MSHDDRIKELQDTVDALRGERDLYVSAWAKEVEALSDEVTRLREALEKYGVHGASCAVYGTIIASVRGRSPSCDCGLAQARGTE